MPGRDGAPGAGRGSGAIVGCTPPRIPPPRPVRPAPPAVLLAALLLLTGCAGGSGQDDARGARHSSARPSPTGPASAGRRLPRPGVTWQWRLSGRLGASVDAAVHGIDGFDHSAATVVTLHRAGRKVIRYVSTGARGDFRPDAGRFPKAVLGGGNGWKGERWPDIRRTDVLEPLMAARLGMCRKGFDAVEPATTDGYRNRTGFPLAAADQVRCNRLVARLAHERGMPAGPKNDLDQIPRLVGDVDFAVDEQCARYGECERLKPFVAAGKAVFHVEYELPTGKFCADSRRLGLSSLLRKYEKYEPGAWRRAC